MLFGTTMTSLSMRTLGFLFLVCVACLRPGRLLADAYPPPPPWQPESTQRENLRRSLTLLNESTPENRKTVRVLFYGQSITEQAWWEEVARYLRVTYPNANLIISNLAIGGHASQRLVKTAEADLYPFQPDLLIFHVYGSHIEYENIIRRVRERTCADILMQTDHITRDDSLTEETDRQKLTPKQWDPWMNHVFLPDTATHYGACRADIHKLWKQYLQANHLKAGDLLKDGVHLNAQGEWLMAELLKPYLAPLPPKPGYDSDNAGRVRTVAIPASPEDEQVRLEFSGTRVDAIFQPNAKGRAKVLIDGKPPSAIPELYGFTRVSAFPNSSWPILLKVDSQTPLIAEEWTIQVTSQSPDGKQCDFALRGSVSGEDGAGSSTNRFASKSGRVVIAPDDWNLAYCVEVFHRQLPASHTLSWRAVLHGADAVEPPGTPPNVEAAVTLAQGLPPGNHKLELRGERLGALLQAVRVYALDASRPERP
jgi:hypothetical protein